MAGRWGRRVIHFANLPIKLLMPSKLENIKEISVKTIPSASKIEIKRVLEDLYGFEVENVCTLNMEGKKKKRGGIVFAKPDYKKAYVTLKKPLSLPSNLYPISLLEEERMTSNKQSKSSIVNEQEATAHWLDSDRGDGLKLEKENTKGDIPGGEKKFPGVIWALGNKCSMLAFDMCLSYSLSYFEYWLHMNSIKIRSLSNCLMLIPET